MAPRHTTRRIREYGLWKVEQRTNATPTQWHVVYTAGSIGGEIGPLGSRRKGRLRAQALASALDSAGLSSTYIDEIKLPEEKKVVTSGSPETWAQWADKATPVPVKIASKGNPVIAGFLNGVYGLDPDRIARQMGLEERTVSQYLSDLRAGRR